MNDTDLIQLNQATILIALAALLDKAGYKEHAKELDKLSATTNAYVLSKLDKTPLPSMAEAVKAMRTKPWPNDLGPDDLVNKACRRAGAEEAP